MRKIIGVVIFAAAVFAASEFGWLHIPTAQERRVQTALDAFRVADSKKIQEALGRFLADSANIHLTVHFGPPIAQMEVNASGQDFTKDGFIHFIDLVLYSLDRYGYQAHIRSFALTKDGKSAELVFSSHEWGEGKFYNGGLGMDMKFASETICTGAVDLSGDSPKLTKADCQSQLEQFPKGNRATN